MMSNRYVHTFKSNIFVSMFESNRELALEEAHKSIYSTHKDLSKMYCDLEPLC